MRDVLTVLETVTEPGVIVDLPYRWGEEINYVCPAVPGDCQGSSLVEDAVSIEMRDV